MGRTNYKPFLALVDRSPKDEDGFAKVSTTLLNMVEHEVSLEPTLYEFQKLDDGTGRIRFTERGKVLKDYL